MKQFVLQMELGESVQRHVNVCFAVSSPENKDFADHLERAMKAAGWQAVGTGVETDSRYQRGIWLFGKGPGDPLPPSAKVLQEALEKAGIIVQSRFGLSPSLPPAPNPNGFHGG